MIKFIADIFKDKQGKTCSCIKDIKRLDAVTVVRFRGDINSATIPILNQNIGNYTKEPLDRHILLDFKDVSDVDSSTIASLLMLLNNVTRSNRKLGIINATQELISLFQIQRVGSLITVYENEAKALKELI